MAVLTTWWTAFAFFLVWLTDYEPNVTFYWIDPVMVAHWEACKALHDTWLGGPT